MKQIKYRTVIDNNDIPNLRKQNKMHWLNQPVTSAPVIEDNKIIIYPDHKTDFWQKTFYGDYSADSGHFLYTTLKDDFRISTKIRIFPLHQYDQAGLVVRISSESWIKASLEYEPDASSKLGSVIAHSGYSDWACQGYEYDDQPLEFRITRHGGDYVIEYRDVPSGDWHLMRIARLDGDNGEIPIQVGIYACAPIKNGFYAEFDWLRIEEKVE